eukprot:CAMPEP_0196593336 /NCGR_PEP_ID=MMETSP1081-20130531/75367_1 /TAXON_ID=36882 /ORGANISM="Pyramimonas amylifera, Strain CCMP720" /LENGTH=193 /DNA_ID=CAMNT_0041917293 /DNA_START=117 /DNA_END=698 /DNA_ORIENTATION=+
MALHYWSGNGGMQEHLRDVLKLQSLSCAEAWALQAPTGASVGEAPPRVTLVDVRAPQDFKDGHAPGSVNVPLYMPIQGLSMKSLLRRAVYLVNGMAGTELNPSFISDLRTALPDSAAPLAVLCTSGGTTEASSTAGLEGKKSRSLIAIYRIIVEGGYSNVVHVDGGIREWGEIGLPLEGDNLSAWKEKAGTIP